MVGMWARYSNQFCSMLDSRLLKHTFVPIPERAAARFRKEVLPKLSDKNVHNRTNSPCSIFYRVHKSLQKAS